MIRLTINQTEAEAIEIESKKLLGKDFPSNTIVDYTLESGKTIKIRPYYRKKIAGKLCIYAEEEISPM